MRIRLTELCLLLAAAFPVQAQYGQFQIPAVPTETRPPRQFVEHSPRTPTLPVAFSIPVGALGFSIHGDSYLLRKQRLVSLDFVGEDRLLFSFRVSGLIERNADDSAVEKQQIRAVVLSVPDGKVEARAEWVVPDRSRYLWMLNDGHFLLRVRDGLDQGDGELRLSDYLHNASRLLWIQLDPEQKVLITNALEEVSTAQSIGALGPQPQESDPTVHDGPAKDSDHQVLVARTLKRASKEEIRVSRVPWTSQTNDWPMNDEGYLERSKQNGHQWLLNLNYFAGGSREFAHVDSTCAPRYDFVSDKLLLMYACDPEKGWTLGLMSMDGKSQWQLKAASNAIWPLVVAAEDGSRVVRETMLLKRSAYRYKRLLGAKDFEGQMVRVFDVSGGKVLLESPLTPMFDGGGNIAISPSGRRVAILNAGAIQIFELPATSSAVGSH